MPSTGHADISTQVSGGVAFRGKYPGNAFGSDSGLDRDVDGRLRDFWPGSAKHDARRFRIEPKVEFVPGSVYPFLFLRLRRDTAVHDHQLLRQPGELRIELNRRGYIRQRPAATGAPCGS